LVNLAGLPFTLGFFIKHFLLLAALNNIFLLWYVGVLLILSAVTGLFYSYRLYSSVFFDSKKSDSSQHIATSRDEIKSRLFGATTIAANATIVGLILTGTILSFMYYVVTFYPTLLKEFFDLLNFTKAHFWAFLLDVYAKLLTISLFNFVVAQLVLLIIVIVWRFIILKDAKLVSWLK